MPRWVDDTEDLDVITPDGTELVRVAKNGASKAVPISALADADLAAHVAASDPHPQYLKEATARDELGLDTNDDVTFKSVTVDDAAYDASTWNGSTAVPTRNAVRDKIASLAQADIAGLTTADSPQFAGINLGHASDTTLARAAAGRATIEGKELVAGAFKVLTSYGVDNTGSSDVAAVINALIDADPDGTMYYAPAGTYKVSGVIKLSGTSANKTRRALIGSGRGTRFVMDSGVTTNVIEITNGSEFIVSDLTIIGNKGTVATPGTDVSYRYYNGIYIGGHSGSAVSDVVVRNVRTEACPYAGYMIGSGPVQVANIGDGADNVRIVGCYDYNSGNGGAGGKQLNCQWIGNNFDACDAYGILVDVDSIGVVVANNALTVDAGASSKAIFAYDAVDVTIIGNTIVGGTTGIAVDNATGNSAVASNVVKGVSASGISVANSTHLSVTSNIIDDPGNYGITLVSSAHDVAVNANVIRSAGFSGMNVSSCYSVNINGNVVSLSAGHGILATSCSALSIIGNQCTSNGGASAGTYDGIRLTDAISCVVNDNYCTDLQGTKTQAYGIRTDGTSNVNELFDNFLTGNLTGTYSLVNTNRYAFNGESVIGQSTGFGGAITAGNGLVQLAEGTTKANGVAFGTDTFLFRAAAGFLRLEHASDANWQALAGSVAAVLRAVSSGVALVGSTTNHPFYVRTNNTDRMTFDTSGNVGLGVSAFGTSAAKVFGVGAGTAPTTAPADMGQMWVEDANGTAGKASLHMMSESGTGKQIVVGALIKTNTGDPTQVHEGLVCINTFDNTAKIYADGGWRTIASGW